MHRDLQRRLTIEVVVGLEDNFDCKSMNTYFKYESCKKSFSLSFTVTTLKLNMERSVKLEIKLNLKN